MHNVPTDLMHRLRSHRQEHVLFGWDELPAAQRAELIAQLAGIDFGHLDHLYAHRDKSQALPADDQIQPVPMISGEAITTHTTALGHAALAAGEVAVLLVAGGQGTRLGFDKPKGLFKIGPVSNKSLFEIHADKVFALSRRYGKPVPLLVMTSPVTHEDTEAFFRENKYFGLAESQVSFFQQGTMPALTLEDGKLLMEKPGHVFSSPNGHGGTLTALSDSGLLDELDGRGVRQIFYFQVDNPLVRLADPAFLGEHIRVRSEVSSRAIEKAYPKEKMGVLAVVSGKCGIIEYSDMPDQLVHAMSPDGKLLHRAGSPAIHLFDVGFLKRITQGETRLPYHYARKKVPHMDATGKTVTPARENALKFEMFVFDALPMADRWLVVESPREVEFAPVKNASGVDSPETCKQAITNLAADWLFRAGATVEKDDDGNPVAPLEVSPRFALDAGEFAARIHPARTINEATLFE